MPDTFHSLPPAEQRRLIESDPIIEVLVMRKWPVTRDSYLELHWGEDGPIPKELPAELEMELPPFLRRQ
jgi:hypothetical protein